MSFDRLAPHYRWMESLLAGGKLQRCRTAFLPALPPPRHALLLGEGNGRFLCEFVGKFPNARVTCLDASRAMLKRARANVAAESGNVEFVHADILDWSAPGGTFDLIVTHFFLDCFRPDQLNRIVSRVATAATDDAAWLLADFCQPEGGWRKWRARLILQAMYLFFRKATTLPASHLTPPDPFLEQNGFVRAQRKYFECGLLHSDLWVRATP